MDSKSPIKSFSPKSNLLKTEKSLIKIMQVITKDPDRARVRSCDNEPGSHKIGADATIGFTNMFLEISESHHAKLLL